MNEIDKAYNASKSHDFKLEEWMTKEWEDIKKPEKFGQVKDTGVSVDHLKKLGTKICTLPQDWEFHPVVRKIYEARLKAVTEGKGIDMGTAEALAFASLIDEGF
jgi:2-oxoglutarate dehydrogenase E1 component